MDTRVKAWLDPVTGKVVSAADKLHWETIFGEGGKAMAAAHTVPLGDLIDQRKVGGAVACIHPDTLAEMNSDSRPGTDKPSAVWPASRAALRGEYVLLFTAESVMNRPLPLPVATEAMLRKLASEYRPTMPGDVLHHWAAELVQVIRSAP